MVENLIRTLSLSDADKGIITLQTYTDDWSVNFIRHKKREAYCVDDKHVLTVTFVRECQLEKQPRNELVSIHPDYYCEPHTEIEASYYIQMLGLPSDYNTNLCTF